MRARIRTLAGRSRAVFVASDPGLLRLWLAVTTMTVLLLTLLLLTGLAKVLHQSPVGALLGAIIAAFATMVITTSDPPTRRVTTLLMLPTACCTLILAALLSSLSLLGHVLIVAVMVTAVLLRRLGPRGLAVGMAGYMAYFFALFLRVSGSQILWLIACLAVGIGINLLVRDVLLTDPPQKMFSRLLRSLQAQAGIVVVALHTAVSAEAGETPPSRQRPGRRLDALGAAAGMVEEKIAEASARVLPSISNSELSLRIFDFELAVERLTAVLTPVLEGQRELTSSTRTHVGAELRRLGHLLRHLPPSPQPAATEADTAEIDSGKLSDYERRIFTALHHLDDACSNIASPYVEDGNPLEEPEPVASDTESGTTTSGEATVPGSWLDPTGRQ
ncbi:MAG: hypothetical protein ACRDQZ_10835, partial [Mycobacteriales bacterium]